MLETPLPHTFQNLEMPKFRDATTGGLPHT
jgi:hypothetical protein